MIHIQEMCLMFHLKENESPACDGLDVNLFYPISEDDNSREVQTLIPQLTRICDSCEVFNKCREWAIVHEEYGFWGGMTGEERRLYRRRNNIRLERPWKSEYLKGIKK